MSLMPTLRSKRRYMVFQIQICDSRPSTNIVDIKEFIKSMNARILYLYGVLGASEIDAKVLKQYYFSEKGRGMVRCNSRTVERLRYALITIKEINGKNISMEVLGVSGTIKSAKEKYLC